MSIKGIYEYLPKKSSDMEITDSDCIELEKVIKFSPETGIDSGITKFVNWYKAYYN